MIDWFLTKKMSMAEFYPFCVLASLMHHEYIGPWVFIGGFMVVIIIVTKLQEMWGYDGKIENSN